MGEKQELLAKLRAAKEVKGLSYQDIVDITEENGEAISIATVKRVFAKDSDLEDFRYRQTVRPIVRAVLGMDEATEPPAETPSLQQSEQYYAEIVALKAVVDLKSTMLEKAEAEAQKKIDFLKATLDDYKAANKWYKRVIAILGVICFLAMVAVILDLAIGTVGWIRY